MSAYQIGLYLGWLNVVLVFLLLLKYFKFKKYPHLLFAVLLIVFALVHSSLVWGVMEFHSGQLLFLSIAVAGGVAFSGKRLKFAKWFLLHRVFAGVAFIFLLIHLYDVLF